MFAVVVFGAECGEVRFFAQPAVLDVDRVVEVAHPCGLVAADESAGFVSDLQPSSEFFRNLSGLADSEHDSGVRVGEQADHRGCVCGELFRGLHVDGSVAFEHDWLVFLAEEGEHGNGDHDLRGDAVPVSLAEQWGDEHSALVDHRVIDVAVVDDPVGEQPDENVRLQLGDGAGLFAAVAMGAVFGAGDVGEPVDDRHPLLGWQVGDEVSHCVACRVEGHTSVLGRLHGAGVDAVGVGPFAQDAGFAVELRRSKGAGIGQGCSLERGQRLSGQRLGVIDQDCRMPAGDLSRLQGGERARQEVDQHPGFFDQPLGGTFRQPK